MRKKHFLFAALFFAALAFGFVGCENPNGDLLNNGDDNTGITDNDSTTNNPDQGGDNNGGTKPTTPEAPTLVATGGATDVECSSVTLWGRLNTDTLIFFPNVKWGIECSTSKETIRSHSGNKTLCTTDLVGENFDEYTVAFTGLECGKMLYYNAYLLINDIKYIYGEVDSVQLAVKLTVKSNNTSYGTVTGSGYYMPGDEVTITATPKLGFEFVEWNDGNIDNPRTVTINEDITYTAKFKVIPTVIAGTENGYDYVDLGLPSGLKWATCNVGATKPEKYGKYYAWGETITGSRYDWSTYNWCNGYSYTLTKYCTRSNYGTVDNRTVLELTDDAARANWGGQWRMPTKAEWTELCENCEWTWTSNGRIVTSKTNGNSIFLPAAGYRFYDYLYSTGDGGNYWSSSLGTGYPDGAWVVSFGSGSVRVGNYERCYGLSVRPVLGE